MKIPHDDVEELLRETVALHVMPRYQKLARHEIDEKQANDFVTVADIEAERHLAPRLAALIPASRVLGEEAAFKAPETMAILESGELLWLVDPVDGTRSFVEGKPGFATIVALVRGDEVIAGWIHQPVGDRWVSTERGGGIRIRNLGPGPAVEGRPSGFFLGRTPDGARARDRADEIGVEALRHPGSGAIAFIGMAAGDASLAYFARGWPWDHAAGALIVEEMGGTTCFLEDAARYTPRRWNLPLLMARDEALMTRARAALLKRP
jgi:fructose-1,6-bisphosphatase/inositol monophosphatase family enzyme